MLLQSVHITDYKCIQDSNEFKIADITTLVGKNESGKTAVLEALERFNPTSQSSKEFKDLDYPRNKWRPNMKDLEFPTDTVKTSWVLSESDLNMIYEHFEFEFHIETTVFIKNGYNNERKYDIEVNEEHFVSKLIERQNFNASEKSTISAVKTIIDLKTKLNGLVEKTPKQSNLVKYLNETFTQQTLEEQLSDLLETRLPHFIYFSDYYKLPGKVSLDEYIDKKKAGNLSDSEKVFSSLLELVGTTPEDLNTIGTIEHLEAALEAVSNRLTEQIFEYWSQNDHLEVQFNFRQGRPQDIPPYNKGFVFRTNIRNRRHWSTVNFDDRSRGFVWFFSFLVWFSQVTRNYGDNIILLLDEPGLNLHAKAQYDLIRYINEKLKPHYQVIYSTHSPFMVDTHNLTSTRLVEDIVMNDPNTGKELLLGTKVSEDILKADKSTLLPLQNALGYEITQSLFIGKFTFLVEGPSDLLYLKYMSSILNKKNGIAIDQNWTICPTGGIDKVATFIALLGGNDLNLGVFIDYHRGQKRKIERLKQNEILSTGCVLTPNSYLEYDEGDTEDLFGHENYAQIINDCYSLEGDSKLDIKDLDSTTRIMPQIEEHMRLKAPEDIVFNHYEPARYLFEQSENYFDTLPNTELIINRFKALIENMNDIINSYE